MDKYIGFYIEEPVGNNIFSYEEKLFTNLAPNAMRIVSMLGGF